jgi:hypothetical protein
MVRASVNGETCAVSLEGVTTVGDVLEQLEVHVPPRDVVVGMRINGVACDDDPAAQVRSLPLIGLTEIDLQTRSPDAFAREARQRLEGYLTAIHQRFESALECFDRGRGRDAFGQYRRGVEELGLLVRLCERLARLGAPVTGDDDAIASDLQGVCDRLWAAHDGDDFSALRDVLAERLLPLLERWRDVAQSGV